MGKIKIYSWLIALLMVVVYCANPGTPTGGPRDRKPPVLVNARPAANSTGFKGNMATLVFDENIQVKDIESKFVVSPPMAVKPKIDAHGNTIRIRFDSDTILQPSTTYTFDFADCISDLNENNILENFAYSFSTGESTDTMMISGNVYDAQDSKPVKGIYIALQSNLSDSAFNTVPPIRLAKTDEYGRFAIKNVPNGREYHVFALDDQNRNFLFDLPIEKIAWLDQTVTPSYEIRQINDSVRIDSLSLSPDTAEWVFEKIVRDTLVYTPDSLLLFAFNEPSYEQYITADNRPKRNLLNLIFNCPMTKKPKITFPGQDETVEHSVNEFSINNDTCNIWITDSLIYKGDSVIVAVNYLVLDSLKQLTEHTDTLNLWFFDQSKDKKNDNNRRRNKRDNGKEKKAIVPTLNIKSSSTIGVYSNLSINSETPLSVFDWSHIHLTHKKDTIYEPITYTQIDDTINIRRKLLKAPWIAGDEYRLVIDSAAISDIYGLSCDSTCLKIEITTLDKYGTLYINVDSVPENGLLQLLDSKGNVVRQVYLPQNGKAAFKYLNPSEYSLRILIDKDRDGKWTTGLYSEKRQPEAFIYYMEKIKIRPNWDIKVVFEVNNYTPDKYARKFFIKKQPKKRNF